MIEHSGLAVKVRRGAGGQGLAADACQNRAGGGGAGGRVGVVGRVVGARVGRGGRGRLRGEAAGA
eukprot:15474775-Alexandrium_andersonii.AAC.1